jgi:hypothetical protein
MVLQNAMSSVFSGMGLVTMLFPTKIINMAFTPQFLGRVTAGDTRITSGANVSPALRLITQCFGAQALLCGWVMYSTKWDARAYKHFGLSMIPFLLFDFHYWKNGVLTEFGALGDAVGNLFFSWCAYKGWYYLKEDECCLKCCQKDCTCCKVCRSSTCICGNNPNPHLDAVGAVNDRCVECGSKAEDCKCIKACNMCGFKECRCPKCQGCGGRGSACKCPKASTGCGNPQCTCGASCGCKPGKCGCKAGECKCSKSSSSSSSGCGNSQCTCGPSCACKPGDCQCGKSGCTKCGCKAGECKCTQSKDVAACIKDGDFVIATCDEPEPAAKK